MILIITNCEPPRVEDGRTIRYEFELGKKRYSAFSDFNFQEVLKQALLKHPHEKVELSVLDEKIYSRKFMTSVYCIINLHNHLF